MDGSAEMAIKINRDFWDANGGDPSGFELIGSNYVKVRILPILIKALIY